MFIYIYLFIGIYLYIYLYIFLYIFIYIYIYLYIYLFIYKYIYIYFLLQEKYCDATIACQGKYFAVHRIVLSTCSDYFEEIFERMQCQHPYIVFKDIGPADMEMLLNYMYEGEVNVVQERLPNLIKAAEALRIKGLAVSDEMYSGKESTGKKRSNPSKDNPEPKKRSEERRFRRNSSSGNEDIGRMQTNENSFNSQNDGTSTSDVSQYYSFYIMHDFCFTVNQP
ncbi:UNVERIFIED_CONTAM: hypothetical protein GTU68_003009 [Idotea baltica]|nr:hypothetical protein [Idotea baltica]